MEVVVSGKRSKRDRRKLMSSPLTQAEGFVLDALAYRSWSRVQTGRWDSRMDRAIDNLLTEVGGIISRDQAQDHIERSVRDHTLRGLEALAEARRPAAEARAAARVERNKEATRKYGQAITDWTNQKKQETMAGCKTVQGVIAGTIPPSTDGTLELSDLTNSVRWALEGDAGRIQSIPYTIVRTSPTQAFVVARRDMLTFVISLETGKRWPWVLEGAYIALPPEIYDLPFRVASITVWRRAWESDPGALLSTLRQLGGKRSAWMQAHGEDRASRWWFTKKWLDRVGAPESDRESSNV